MESVSAVYRSLSEQQIRILDLLPGHIDSPIICTLRVAKLSEPFEALSYCWGDASDKDSIICNDVLIPVTKSLYGALKVLRTDHVRSMWIDAVCINQDDVDERNEQVQLMRQIYESAKLVIVWLGEHGTDTDPALNLISTIAKGCGVADGKSNPLELRTILEHYGMPSSSDLAWASLKTFLYRPWFTRIWVVQELVLARKAVVICGKRSISWADIEIASTAIDTIHYGKLVNMQHLRVMGLQRYKWRRAQNDLDLTRILFGERVQSTTDDRDRVYGLIGLATDVGKVLPIRVNYRLDTSTVYTDCTRAIINSHRSLSILTAAGQAAEPSKYQVPFWVPDWSIGGNAWPLMCRVGELNFAASKGADADIFPDHGTSLDILQIPYDTVSGVSPPFTLENPNQAFVSWIRLAGADESDLGRLKAFMRTVIANLGFGSEKPTDYEQTAFLEWYKRLMVGSGRDLPNSLFKNLEYGAEEADARYLLFSDLISQAAGNRSFFITKNGLMGIGPRHIATEDVVSIVKGACVPLILRNMEASSVRDQPESCPDKYLYIGDSYVDGIMNGEGYDEGKLKRCELV